MPFVLSDYTLERNGGWFCFTMPWMDPHTVETRTWSDTQVYRIEADKCAAMWLILQPVGPAWTDAIAPEHWTSPPGIIT